ncbi:MAG: hypothetical protein P9L94_16060 [Candidatus Hinthialibacter antarcticus]|nr:hypothetical protein [Candidatus Hinthialibacter antarcticus]
MGKTGKSTLFQAVVVDPHHHDLAKIVKMLESSQLVEVVGETTSRFLGSSLIERNQPDLVFITAPEQNVTTENFIQGAKQAHKECCVVVLGTESNSELILQCFRAGADEFLTLPLKAEELIPTFDRVRQKQAAMQSGSGQGKVIGVWGARGGCGATTVACNTAYSLLNAGPTMLVDFHFAQGDLSVYFDMQPTLSLMDISETADRLDRTLIESVTAKHECGLHLMLQPYDQHPPQLSNDEMCSLIYELQHMYPFVVLDLGHDEENVTLAAPYLHQLILTVKPDLPSLFLANRKINWLGEIGYDVNQLTVVVNGYDAKNSLSKGRIAKALKTKKIDYVRSDEKRVHAAINQGQPLRRMSRWGKAAKDIERIAKRLHSGESQPSLEPLNDYAPEKAVEKSILAESIG